MHKYNFKNLIKCNSLHVRKWLCGLLAAQIILIPNYSFAQINSDITVQQMNNSFGVSAFDLTNYNLALNLNFGNKNPDTTYAALTAIYRGLAQAFGPAYYYEIQNNTLNSPARYSETQNVLRSLQAIEQNQWYMNQNLISSDSSLSGINSKLATQNNLLYDYNHIGDSSFSIGTTSRNTAVNTYNIVTQLNNLQQINWISGPWQFEYYTTPSGFQPSLDTSYSYQTYPRLYVRFGAGTLTGQNVFKVTIPVTAASNDNRNNFIDHVALYRDNVLLTDDFIEYYYSPELQQIYLYFKSIPSYGFNIAIFFKNNWILRSGTPTISYVPYDTLDYYLVSYLGALEEIANKDFTADISGDVNVDTSDLENKVDQVIDAIDDLALTNNNVKLNLNINNNTGSDGSNIIGRLQNFFNNGTSISDFFDNVDDAESGWFTQTNSDLINTLSGGYVNLYE